MEVILYCNAKASNEVSVWSVGLEAGGYCDSQSVKPFPSEGDNSKLIRGTSVKENAHKAFVRIITQSPELKERAVGEQIRARSRWFRVVYCKHRSCAFGTTTSQHHMCIIFKRHMYVARSRKENSTKEVGMEGIAGLECAE